MTDTRNYLEYEILTVDRGFADILREMSYILFRHPKMNVGRVVVFILSTKDLWVLKI